MRLLNPWPMHRSRPPRVREFPTRGAGTRTPGIASSGPRPPRSSSAQKSISSRRAGLGQRGKIDRHVEVGAPAAHQEAEPSVAALSEQAVEFLEAFYPVLIHPINHVADA